MLVITRNMKSKEKATFTIGNNITIEILKVLLNGDVCIGITAPKNVNIFRLDCINKEGN